MGIKSFIEIISIFKNTKYGLIICINEEKVPKNKAQMEKINGMTNDCSVFGNAYTYINEDNNDLKIDSKNI